MDLIPTPAQSLAAAGTLTRLVAHQGLADLRPTPRRELALVETAARPAGSGRPRLWRYLSEDGVPGTTGDPVLLVAPVAAPAACYDLRRGTSLVERLVATGRPTYVVEQTGVSFRERSLDAAPWVAAVADAVRAAAADAAAGAATVGAGTGGGERPVHLAGWSLGGTLALLAATDPDLPLASLSLLAAATDTAEVPMLAPERPLPLHPLLRRVTGLTPARRLVDAPLSLLTHLDDPDLLAQVEAVARLRAHVPAYRGRTWGQLFHRFLPGNALADGALRLGDRDLALADVTAPVLVLAGAEDGVAPLVAVRAPVPLLTGSPEVVLEVVPGGHLGMLTGRGAPTGTWPALEEWWAAHDTA